MRLVRLGVALGLFGLLAAATDTTELQTLIDSLKANAIEGRCKAVVADAGRLGSLSLPEEFAEQIILSTELLTVSCQYQLKAPDKAVAAARAALKRRPDNLEMSKVWLGSALIAGRLDDALEAMTLTIQGNPGDFSNVIEEDWVFDLLRQLRQNGRIADAERLEVQLANSRYGEADSSLRDYFRQSAVKVAIAGGDIAKAEAVAAQIVSVSILRNMLTEIAYRPIWEGLEQAVGPGMSLAKARALKAAEAEVEALGIAEQSPLAASAQTRLMQALWRSGRREEALRVGADGFASPAALADATQEGGWLVNAHAGLLAADGQTDAAVRRFDALADLGIESRPWLISMRINRAVLLLDHGRAKQLLGELNALEADAGRYGSPYAEQLVRRLRICALVADGQLEAANKLRADLLKHESDAPTASIAALKCLGDEDAATKILVASLADPQFSDTMVSGLQALLPEDDPKDDTLRPLLARAEVAAAYAKAGRDLPESLR